MRPPARVSSALPAAAWAVVGVLVAHVAAYRLVYPDAHVHDSVLAASGHGWLELAIPMALLLVLVATVVGLVGGWRSRQRGTRFVLLATVQIVAYVGIEITERVLVGADARSLLHELRDHDLWLVLVVGCVLQLVTAWLASAASRAVARAGARPLPAARPVPPVQQVAPMVARILISASPRVHSPRAPPLPSVPFPVIA